MKKQDEEDEEVKLMFFCFVVRSEKTGRTGRRSETDVFLSFGLKSVEKCCCLGPSGPKALKDYVFLSPNVVF